MPRKKDISKMRMGLMASRWYLQEIARQLQWSFSKKNYLPYELYRKLKRQKQSKEEQRYFLYLKQQKMIEVRKIGKKLRVTLTEKGWNAALRDRVKTTKTPCKDGLCFVIFDIPETERLTRRILRYFLRECGFKRLQDSVWVTDRDVVIPLRELLQRHKLERWIRIIVGDIISASTIDRLKIRKNYHK